MNPDQAKRFAEASIHVGLEEFTKRITIEANRTMQGIESDYRKANIQALRKALYSLGLHVIMVEGVYGLHEYRYRTNDYAFHAVPKNFQSERGAIIYALARVIDGKNHS